MLHTETGVKKKKKKKNTEQWHEENLFSENIQVVKIQDLRL